VRPQTVLMGSALAPDIRICMCMYVCIYIHIHIYICILYLHRRFLYKGDTSTLAYKDTHVFTYMHMCIYPCDAEG